MVGGFDMVGSRCGRIGGGRRVAEGRADMRGDGDGYNCSARSSFVQE